MNIRSLAVISSSLCAVAITAHAGGKKQPDPCQQYYGNGYCTDYVNSYYTTKVRGDARTWPSNVATSSIRQGDAAIFRQQNHVARIDQVNYGANGQPKSLKVSEMNYGRGWANQQCQVTSNYGVVTSRTVPINQASGFYRNSSGQRVTSTTAPQIYRPTYYNFQGNATSSRPTYNYPQSTSYANSTVPYIRSSQPTRYAPQQQSKPWWKPW